MPKYSLKIDIRRKRIIEMLRGSGRVLVSELSEALNATPATIRNDLSVLERDGQLIRVQGGAILSNQTGTTADPAQVLRMEEKKAIALRAAQMVKDGDMLFINSGSTTLEVAAALKARQNLHIVTNSVSVAMMLAAVNSFRVLLLGGELNGQYGFVYGSDTLDQMERYRADWAILSVDSISAECGVTTYHPEEAVIDRAMWEHAKRAIVVADHSKIGRAGFARFHTADDSLCLITDAKADAQMLKELEGRGVETCIV